VIEATFSLILRRLSEQCEQSSRWQHDGGRQVGLQLLHQLVAGVKVGAAGPVPLVARLGHSGYVLGIRVHLNERYGQASIEFHKTIYDIFSRL